MFFKNQGENNAKPLLITHDDKEINASIDVASTSKPHLTEKDELSENSNNDSHLAASTSSGFLVSNDVSLWPTTLTDAFRASCVEKGSEYFQNNDGVYAASKRNFKTQNRSLSDVPDDAKLAKVYLGKI
ncbi:uncharacterized protein LOC126888042 [Diabrotica virgifera virgifera]|uniref:Uncharacterized protein n=1 Tax=Diabrotica virgifera virgifera TaxID=50390 RepID=A0ABM5KP92_DIAVI|nr:uncharacterized protein LOC126888042 [Diabrotica virgifera virgifera]